MPSHSPQNAEEAGYISFALIEALSDLLIDRGIITRRDFDIVLETAATRLQVAQNTSSARSAEFVRRVLLRKEELE